MSVYDDHREEICQWLRANGADPAKIPWRSTVTLADGLITYQVFIPGKRFMDPMTGELFTQTETRPMVVEPSETVRAWLLPRCPTRGR